MKKLLRDEFNALVDRAKLDHPKWFELERDEPANEHDVRDAELQMGVHLPDEYRHFLRDHGGGYFAFALVFGAEKRSEWYIVEKNRDQGAAFLVVSDPGTGDAYGFRVEQGRCRRDVARFDHETSTITGTSYSDFYEFMAERALRRRS